MKANKKIKYFQKLGSTSIGGKWQVLFVPDININCQPPYIKGKRETCWAYIKGVNPCNKKQSENALGMKLQPLTENL